MFTATRNWLYDFYGSMLPGQKADSKKWLLTHGVNIPPNKIEEWSDWKHLIEYQPNTNDIVDKALAIIGKEFRSELEAHEYINCLRVPHASASYKKMLLKANPVSVLELGVGGDSAISTAVFLSFIEGSEQRRMVSVDRNPLGRTWKRYNQFGFWEFVQSDSVEYLEKMNSQGTTFELVFIDSLHSYSHTSREIEFASGITNFILMDDITFEGNSFDDLPGGVKRAVEEWKEKNPDWDYIEDGTVGLFSRKGSVGPKTGEKYKPVKKKFKKKKLKKSNKVKVAVAMAHGHAPKWLQTSLHSFRSFDNIIPYDIFIAETWPGHASLKAITEVPSLFHAVTFIPCKARLHSHATGLDETLEYIANKGYKYLFTTETDCIACQDGWLDWFVQQLEDNPDAGMAGFFWDEGNNHYNINPSGTLYRVDMLLKYHKEVKENNEGVFYHPRGNKLDTEQGMDDTIKNVVGVFSETRGIKNPNPEQEKQIRKGVPQAAWFEPGAWLYYRSLGEYGYISVKCDHVYTKYGDKTAPEATYYGGKNSCVFKHLWGGTRCYDGLKHRVDDMFVRGCAPYWMQREDKIWKEIVPENIRAKVYDVEDEINLVQMIKDNMFFNIRDFVPGR